MQYLNGVLDLSIWGLIAVSLAMVHLTTMGVTLYLHRDQAHRGLDLHPALRHFFRLWIWMSSGMGTKEWVAVHRKHHAKCETEEDPHSPVIFGLKKVLLEGAELYRMEKNKPGTLEKYGRGTPDDWMERNVYGRSTYGGITMMFFIDVILFGPAGITVFAFQMMGMPFFAAGIINGVGHHSGYRNFESDDAATNIVPWGVFLGGEELHNNHHAFPSSAKFSVRKWEFDIGWLYIRIFEALGLAKVKKVAPRPRIVPDKKKHIDLDTLRAVIVNRMHVMRDYSRKVTLPVFKKEVSRAKETALYRRAKRLLIRHPGLLDERARARLSALLAENHALKTVHEFRERLQSIWKTANVSNEKLLSQLREWCAQAEASGIKVLQEFAAMLRSYEMRPGYAAAT